MWLGRAKPWQSAGECNPFPWEPRNLGTEDIPLRLGMGCCPDHSGLSAETLSLGGESGFLVGKRRKKGVLGQVCGY